MITDRTDQRLVNETFKREFNSAIERGKKVRFLFLDLKMMHQRWLQRL